MQNNHQDQDQNDLVENHSDNEHEQFQQEIDEERRQQIKRRVKARNQFRSPWFILGVIFLLFMVIYPRCSYKDNVRKEMERKNQDQTSEQISHQDKPKTTQEEQGMVPKF